jgi:hypothetical protein
VWLPYGAVNRFFGKIEAFASEQTRSGAPKNQNLVANIGDLRLAVLRDLWQEPDDFPNPDEPRWWELWLVRLDTRSDPGATLRALADEFGWPMVPELLTFPDNVIALVRASANQLTAILNSSATPRELHHARVTSEILRLDHDFQQNLIDDLADRIRPAAASSAAVCVLDTGLMSGHRLLAASVDATESALFGESPADLAGHGTQMAGLALFGDLNTQMYSAEPVRLRHRIESVKVLRNEYDTETEPENYGTVTATAAARVEVGHQRQRAFSMAVTADGPDGSDGRPTSWSASLDALAFGTDIERSDDGVKLLGQPDPEAARLFIVSAGNISRDEWKLDHLAVSDVSRVQNPAQAWNVLTVGAYTELTEPPAGKIFTGWSTLVPAGELSPFSRTSMTFDRGWPIKPDIVMEGGNLLVSPARDMLDTHDAVSLLTTSNSEFRLLTTANATSAATAQAARLAATAMEQYPSLWPEAIRALLAHSAEWTPAMWTHFNGAKTSGARLQTLRRYGWGVATEERVLNSASSSVTLIVQDEFQPFELHNGAVRMAGLRLHPLPWPQEQLRDLFGAKVRMRVTLSYFVEPNPSNRGWKGRYRYASHGLRFDVKQPTETIEEFRQRIAREAALEESGSTAARSSDNRWFLGSRTRNAGSVQGDIWFGTGAELADSGYIGVVPVGGWWKENNRRDRIELPVRYALLVSLLTDQVTADIYTPIATQIGIPVPITT